MPKQIIDGKTFIGKKDPNGGDSAALSFGPDGGGSLVSNCVINGADAEWALKISHCFNLTFVNCIVKGGTERAFDMVRGGNVSFINCHFERGDYRTTTHTPWSTQKTCDIGIKGGARDITFDSCSLNDLLLGDYSIYNQRACPITRRIKLKNCTNTNPWDIIVRGLYAEHIQTDATKVRELRLLPLFTSLYFLYNKHFGDDRKLNADELVATAEDLA